MPGGIQYRHGRMLDLDEANSREKSHDTTGRWDTHMSWRFGNRRPLSPEESCLQAINHGDGNKHAPPRFQDSQRLGQIRVRIETVLKNVKHDDQIIMILFQLDLIQRSRVHAVPK